VRYRVEFTPAAEADIEAAYAWIAAASPAAASRWFFRIRRVAAGLRTFPRRCGLAAESRHLGGEIRQFVYGDYRILFEIEGRVVRVLHVRHGARRRLGEEE